MKLGVFINQTFFTDGKTCSTDLSFIRFIESFSSYFDKIIIFAPTIRSNSKVGHYICSEIIDLVSLPFYGNVKDLARRVKEIFPETKLQLKNNLPCCDLLWIVGPHPLGLLANYIAGESNCSTFYQLRGNILNDVKKRYRGKEFLLAYLYAQYMHWGSVWISRKVPTLVVGSELYKIYKTKSRKVYQISPSLITEADIEYAREMSASKTFAGGGVIKIIFVGRPEPEKGLPVLFQALAKLNLTAEIKFSLIIVGAAQKGSEDKELEIRKLAVRLGIEPHLVWKGYVPYGDNLKNLYREADIFILPSLAEGIPKVIYEAMANGTPIIATNVGGIPDVVTNKTDGLLIEPDNVDQIVQTLLLLVNDPEKRKKLQNNAFDTVENHTMGKARDEIMTIVSQ